MIKDIIDNILLAEQRAEEIEKAAAKAAQDIRADAHNAAEDFLETSKEETKKAVKRIMLKASEEGEKQAAEMIKKSRAHDADASLAAEKNLDKAVDRIVKEFFARI